MPPTAPTWEFRSTADCLLYEVIVEVPDRHRGRFAEWFPSVALDWTTQPEVRSFRAFRGADVEAHWIRFRFAFADEGDWEQFVERSAHRERMAHLETVSTSVRTSLWAPAAVSLTGDGATLALLGDDVESGRSLDRTRQREPLTSGR